MKDRVIIAVLAFVVGLIVSYFIFKPGDIEETTTTDTKITVTEKKDSTGLQFIDTTKVSVDPVVIKIPVKKEFILSGEPEDSVELVESQPDSVEVQTSKYQGKEELSNGTIDWTIYADNLYATEFDLTTKDSLIERTTTITRTIQRSRLYVGGGVDLNMVNKYPERASIGLMYNRKQKWAIDLTISKDFTGLLPPGADTYMGARLWIGL